MPSHRKDKDAPVATRRQSKAPKRFDDEESDARPRQRRRTVSEEEENAINVISGLVEGNQDVAASGAAAGAAATQATPPAPEKQSKALKQRKARQQKDRMKKLSAAHVEKCSYGCYRVDRTAQPVAAQKIGRKHYFESIKLISLTDAGEVVLRVGQSLTANVKGVLLSDYEIWSLHTNAEGAGQVQIMAIDPGQAGQPLLEPVRLGDIISIGEVPQEWDRSARDAWWKAYYHHESAQHDVKMAAKSAKKQSGSRIGKTKGGQRRRTDLILELDLKLIEELREERALRERLLAELRASKKESNKDIIRAVERVTWALRSKHRPGEHKALPAQRPRLGFPRR